MKMSASSTVSELLCWSYANLAMAQKAVHDKEAKYTRVHYMIRARLFNGMKKGSMSPRSLMRDQKIRMKMPQECVYCGSTDNLAIDHVVPTNRGGADSGDNAIWACRSCNSSKSDRDLLAWWSASREGFPPLFAVRIYLKQAIGYFTEQGLMESVVAESQGHPFSLKDIPTEFPAPGDLIFSPYHARRDSLPDS